MSFDPALFLPLSNGSSVPLDSLPLLDADEFAAAVSSAAKSGLRVSSLFAAAPQKGGGTELFAILADDGRNRLLAARAKVAGDSFPSIASDCPQAQLFEREIAEQFGLRPEGHPWLKPVRYHASWTGRDAWGRDPRAPILPAVGDFYRVEGEEVHEVSVGPVHAGVIEPGHFRFQCHGERVYHLEIALGFQHRGIERALVGGPSRLSLHYAETAAGDSTAAHAGAYCRLLEALCGAKSAVRADALRAIALELERLANHVGDIGAIAGDTGYLPTSSFCGRIRGDILNMTALLSGNRFGRAFIVPGGAGFDVDEERAARLLKALAAAEREVADAVGLLWESSSVMARLENTGTLPAKVAEELGIVGPAARASGLQRDLRYDQPYGIFRFSQIPVSTYDSCDVFARTFVRALEIKRSFAFARELLENLPGGELAAPLPEPAPASLAVALEEGWRGEVCHVAITDEEGRFARYKIVDPSFHNWPALAYVLRGEEISDFPLCNKSFNLSYCGHDL
jgi:Ni,Fe-hydrogenase III large subunit